MPRGCRKFRDDKKVAREEKLPYQNVGAGFNDVGALPFPVPRCRFAGR